MRRVFFRMVPLALLCLLFSVPQARADSPFTVSGVKVEATAASVSEARNAAIAAGREKAWQVLYRRLTQSQDWPRQPTLGSVQLQRLISSYYPSGEKRSTTRYMAEMTYIFNPKAVSRLMQEAGIAFASSSSGRVLVVPMSPGYSAASAWTAALASPHFANTLVPFDLPTSDSQEASALSGLSFASAGWSDVAPVAARHGANAVVLLLAVPDGAGTKVSLRRLSSGAAAAVDEVTVPRGTSGYAAAAEAAVQMMGNLWKAHAALDSSRKGELAVTVRITSLSGFAALRQTLAKVPNISETSVDAIDVGAARLTLVYLGSIAQLRTALARTGLVLAENGGGWHLSQQAPGREAP